MRDTNTWIDPFGLIAAPASLPNTPGVYIITSGDESYVGSAGIGDSGMNDRVSSTSHAKSQELLNRNKNQVEYIEIEGLDNVTSKKNGRSVKSQKNIILRYYEQQALDAQVKKGRTMLNGRKKNKELARILSPEKMLEAKKLIDEYGIKKKGKVTCS